MVQNVGETYIQIGGIYHSFPTHRRDFHTVGILPVGVCIINLAHAGPQPATSPGGVLLV